MGCACKTCECVENSGKYCSLCCGHTESELRDLCSIHSPQDNQRDKPHRFKFEYAVRVKQAKIRRTLERQMISRKNAAWHIADAIEQSRDRSPVEIRRAYWIFMDLMYSQGILGQ